MGVSGFLRQRRLGAAFLGVAATTAGLAIIDGPEWAGWLNSYHDFDVSLFRGLGIVVLLAGLGVFLLEPHIWQELQDGKATSLLSFCCLLVSASVVTLTIPVQQWRLISYPISLWVFVAGILLLCLLVLGLVALNPTAAPRRPLVVWGTALVAGLAGLMLVLHLASIGHFMRLDMPDEPILASAATEYALRGGLTTAFDGGIYGDPDPSMARYYWLMGNWLKLLDDTSLPSMRAFPLIVAAAAVAVTGVAFWQVTDLRLLQRGIGMVILLSLSPFVRASHSLRPDIGFALMGGMVLVSTVMAFRSPGNRLRWYFAMGAALYPGLEVIPSYALPFAVAVGLLIIVWAVDREARSMDWGSILAYGAGCVVAGLLFLAVHFLPDATANWRYFTDFLQVYLADNQHRMADANVWAAIGYILRFNLIVSPVEIAVIVVPAAWMARRGTSLDRAVVGLLLAASVTMFFPWRGGYTYFALASPFIAFLAARMCQNEYLTMAALFVVVPAMIAAPANDLYTEIRLRENQLVLNEADQITWQIPENITVLGEDKFWYVLHGGGREFIGWHGVSSVQRLRGISAEQALDEHEIEIVVCLETDARCQAIQEYAGFGAPTDFTITNGNYLIYRRE